MLHLGHKSGASWLAGGAGALLMVAVYFLLWDPARVWLAQHAAYPALAALETERAARYGLEARVHLPRIDAVLTGGGAEQWSLAFWIEGGRAFLFPALLLVGLFPRRLYWLYLWGLHLAVGVLTFLFFAAGVAWGEAGFWLYTAVHGYVLPPVSLALPALLLVGGTAETGPATVLGERAGTEESGGEK